MGLSNVISLLGGLALFLYGISLMGDGLNMVAGNRLEVVLYRLTSNPLKGILLGVGVTALIQSSSATSVMAIGFVNSGLMEFSQAVSIILGSIVGTSITGWIVSLSSLGQSGGWTAIFSTAFITGIVAAIGICLLKFSKNPVRNRVGTILLGFAVLMFGMGTMSDAVSPLREDETFIALLTKFSNPLLGILVGIVFTAVIQSSSAAVGILQALSMTGALSFSAAYPIILGIAVGSALPVLLSALGASLNARRTALVHLIIDILGALFCGIVFYVVNAVRPFSFLDAVMTPVSVAALNTAFRIVTVVVLTPCIGLLERLSRVLMKGEPERAGEANVGEWDRLEERFLAHPPLAIEQSRLTVDSMADCVRSNLFHAFALLKNYSDEGFRAVEEQEDSVDRYEDRLGAYLIQITGHELNPQQTAEVSKYLHTIGDLERIGDHAVNIAETAREMGTQKISFSQKGVREMDVLIAAVTEIVNLSFAAFSDNDIDLAYRIEPLEELIDNLCDEMKLHHVERLKTGECTLHHGFAFTDLITNLERVGDHCSNIGVALIELESDSFDAHEYVNSLMKLHTHSFDRYYAEYSAKYSI